jgi:hypothetical protein
LDKYKPVLNTELLTSNHIAIQKGNSYLPENDGKVFVSLDLRCANFNAMKYHNPELVLNCQTWEELIGKFTQYPIFVNNKFYRQRVFWLLEPQKQAKIVEYLMTRVINALLERNSIPGKTIYFNSDEIVFEIPDTTSLQHTVKTLYNIITEEAKELSDFKDIVKMEVYQIGKLSEKEPYYYKQVLVDLLTKDTWKQNVRVVFKSIPPEHFAVCYKHYYNLPLDERDLRVTYDHKTKTYGLLDVSSLRLLPVRTLP